MASNHGRMILDDICVLKIASHLSKADLINFTHVSTRYYNLI